MRISPKNRYQQLIESNQLAPDSAQLAALEQLELIWLAISRGEKAVKGLYIWGDVGRGKTLLMDLFFQALPQKVGLRMHFHHFMAQVHEQLRQEKHRDPLKPIAKRLKKQCQVLCFDEFFINDIGDAMIMQRLFDGLLREGVVLVATSNIPIAQLFDDELLRDRFDLGRALLSRFCSEWHLASEQDYRLNGADVAQTCFMRGEQDFTVLFKQLAATTRLESQAAAPSATLHLGGRAVVCEEQRGALVWFRFAQLCATARITEDYIELAQRFQCVMLSDIPVLGGDARSWIEEQNTQAGNTTSFQPFSALGDDPARRFISLVDELYDRNVVLYLETQVPLAQLYQGELLSFAFRRTLSRLAEMQTESYQQGRRDTL